MTLFAGAETYAPGEAGQQGLGVSGGQNVNVLGRFDLRGLQGPNLLLALALLAGVVWAARRWLR